MDTFADHLRGWLDQRGWSRYRLADESGVSESLLGRYLHPDPRRRITPSPSSCRKIAHALGLDADDVLALAGHREAATDGEHRAARAETDAEEAELLAAYRAVPMAAKPHARIAAVGALRAFVRDNREKPGDRSAVSARPRLPIAA